MIIYSQAPTRLSLFGGGSDLPTYADKYGGLVLNLAINIYQRMTIDEDGSWLESSFPQGGETGFYMKILQEFSMLPVNSFKPKLIAEFDGIIHGGMGSSAAAAVALIGAINRIKNLGLNKAQIAEKAWDIEVNKIGLYGGRQDQYCASFGGINLMEFSKDKVTITSLNSQFINPLLSSIVLFYTGENRKSAKIQEEFKKLSPSQKEALDDLKRIAVDGATAIAEGDIEKVGRLLDEAWEAKKRSNKGVSSTKIDKIYGRAKEHGAWGGKICGAGGGGFMFFIVNPMIRDRFIKDMEREGLQHWDFSIDWNGLQTRVLPND